MSTALSGDILESDAVSLLPSSSSALERELAALTFRIDLIDPSVIETIWNAWSCPSPMLPWLAWALSVDFWDDSWSEVRKRQVISESPRYHRIKGTRRAVELMLELIELPYEMTEWWETEPPRRRGTTRILLSPTTYAAAAEALRKARPLVASAKPKSRSVEMVAGAVVPGLIFAGVAVVAHRTITVEPFNLDINGVNGPLPVALGIYSERTIMIEAAA